MRLHISSSYDRLCWNNKDLLSIDIEPGSRDTIRKTVAFYPKIQFFKVVYENLDSSVPVTSLKLTATVGR